MVSEVYMGSAWGTEWHGHGKHLFSSAQSLKGRRRSGTEGEDQGSGSRASITGTKEWHGKDVDGVPHDVTIVEK